MNETLKRVINRSDNIVFFGGAGVSTASGIPDFRSANGIYNIKGYRIPPEEIISHSFFLSHTEEFYEFYKKHLVFPNAKPNACHYALAKLEETGKLKAVVTQNIDGLHQAAGSKNVYELHGTTHKNTCMKCGKQYDLDYILRFDGVPLCECGGIVKPDVVLYEEPLNDATMYDAANAIAEADTLIVGGTSLTVYPAASFLQYFGGSRLVLINKTETPADSMAMLVIRGDIAEVMKL